MKQKIMQSKTTKTQLLPLERIVSCGGNCLHGLRGVSHGPAGRGRQPSGRVEVVHVVVEGLREPPLVGGDVERVQVGAGSPPVLALLLREKLTGVHVLVPLPAAGEGEVAHLGQAFKQVSPLLLVVLPGLVLLPEHRT